MPGTRRNVNFGTGFEMHKFCQFECHHIIIFYSSANHMKIKASRKGTVDGPALLADILIKEIKGEFGDRVLDEEDQNRVRRAVIDYLNDRTKYPELKKLIDAKLKSSACLDRLQMILEEAETWPSQQDAAKITERSNTRTSERSRWTTKEDTRLYAAVFKFGVEQWPAVAKFHGSRSRNQCNQRWTRALDPAITTVWTQEEIATLLELAPSDKYSWGAVAIRIGTKSDLQCRYKYLQLQKSHKVQPSDTSDKLIVAKELPQDGTLSEFSDEMTSNEDVIWDIDPDIIL